MGQHVSVADPDELARVLAQERTPREDHFEERLQVVEVPSAKRGRIALLHVDVEVVVSVPRNEPVVLKPHALESGGNAVGVGHRAEAVHAVVVDALDHGIWHLHARAFRPELRPVFAGLLRDGVEDIRPHIRDHFAPSACLDSHHAVLARPRQPHRFVRREIPFKASGIRDRNVDHPRLLEAKRLQLLLVDGEFRYLERKDSAALAHRHGNRKPPASVLKPEAADARRRVERTGLKRPGLFDRDDNASERKHIGVARLARRRVLFEERMEPRDVSALLRRDDVGVALRVRPRIAAAVVPEVGASDGEADLVAAAPDEHARPAVAEGKPLVAASGAREVPFDGGGAGRGWKCERKKNCAECLHVPSSSLKKSPAQASVSSSASWLFVPRTPSAEIRCTSL